MERYAHDADAEVIMTLRKKGQKCIENQEDQINREVVERRGSLDLGKLPTLLCAPCACICE